ncbi:Uma2 family endonuclease [Tsukamurella hominis]|uniref:Uma2 family endonuclease n=1 Tax=Tsukamurella hominis TaxID=1970232 RepID=UPI0039EBDA71
MAAPLRDDAPFDPLVDLAGLWTTKLAERFLPLDDMPPAKYECLGGRLVMSPREGTGNSRAALELGAILRLPARNAGFGAYSAVNMRFDDQTWIEPDLAVLKTPAQQVTWVPAEQVLMPVELVSRSSRRRDRIDKPALCAAAGVPFFLRVEIDGAYVAVELHELVDGAYVSRQRAVSGQRFRTDVPFAMDFDPLELLEPGVAPR